MSDFVLLNISSTISQYGSEKRFAKDLLISEFKGKLELITGCQSQWMRLELYNQDNVKMTTMDDERMLGFYSPEDQWRVHVVDTNPSSVKGEFDDLSKVEKYEMNEDDYNNKKDSVRNFMRMNKVGNFSEEAIEAKKREFEEEEKETQRAKTFKIGDRCETSVPKQQKRRGCVMFIGEVEFKPGHWIGVKYDEPLGKNDGSVKGIRYFTCQQKYGGFVRPSHCEVGDFPEEDLGFSDDEIDEM